MKKNKLFFNGKIYTQAGDFIAADSMAVIGGTIAAVGKNLHKDGDFKSFNKIDLKGHTVLPGFVDSHAHFYFLAMTLGNVKLDGLQSLDEVLGKIRTFSRKLGKTEWVTGEGFSPDRWKEYVMPDRYMLDKVTGDRPAAIFSKDQHMLWVNSRALEKAGITSKTPDPRGGKIERFGNGEPSGILMEIPSYFPVIKEIKQPAAGKAKKLHRQALQIAYSKGVTGIHSFDGLEALSFYDELSRIGQLGLRINYYPPGKSLTKLEKAKIRFGYGNDFFRVSGVKIFADGSLGSQTALCFRKYIGSDDDFGIEVTPKAEILSIMRKASRLNLPCAVHAIGDRAIANVLDCLEKAPPLSGRARHRIEHLQMIRRLDISRLKRLGVVASMQPSHCPSDSVLIEKYWGKRGRNCYAFNTLLKRKIPLVFGSDAPIEPLDPIAGIDAAVNRKPPNAKKPFYPNERISVSQAVYGFTAAPAFAVGRESERGFLLPGYKADFIILSEDIYNIPKSRLKDIKVVATFFDGRLVYQKTGYGFPY